MRQQRKKIGRKIRGCGKNGMNSPVFSKGMGEYIDSFSRRIDRLAAMRTKIDDDGPREHTETRF